jgi:GWxTD domain-containing protein
MRTRNVLILITIVISCSFFSLAQKKSPGDLPPSFRKWLEKEVVYIITSLEKDVFLQLETDRERELFIEAFWKQRDPTQGTPANEFKEEHYQRIQHANYTFGRSAPIPGWKTDRGRFYILLGEPQDIERFSGETQIYNTEVWFYQGLAKYGLPAGFHLMFFQKAGAGDYILYSPISDGPQALLTSYFGDQANYVQAFRKLKQVSPSLAQVSLSLIPGESTQFGYPSLASDILLQNIQALPEKAVKNMYAQKFLMYKDIVEVEYTANYIDSDSFVRIFKDESGHDFVHYAIELNRFSVQEFQDKYTASFRINGQVTDMSGRTIYQYEGSLPIELDKTQLRNITYKPFDIYDMFPLVPGSYKFSVLLKNETSQEFTSLERDIVIPEEGLSPQLSQLILGYTTENITSSNLKPFQFGKNQVLFQPNKIFLLKDRIFLYFQILGINPELRSNGHLKYEISTQEESILSYTKRVSDYSNELDISEEFLLAEFSPGIYWLKVSLIDGEQTLHSEREHFEITPVTGFPRPWVFSKSLSPPSHHSHLSVRGLQYLNQGKIEKALENLEKAFHSQPNQESYVILLARAYLLAEEFAKARSILLPFSGSESARYEVYSYLGQSHQALGELDQAIVVYNKALSRFGLNIGILNSLGECYFRLNNTEEAAAAWNKSIEINPQQPDIKAKLDSLKNRQGRITLDG